MGLERRDRIPSADQRLGRVVQQLTPCMRDRQGAIGEQAPTQSQHRQRVLRDGKRQVPS